MKEKDKDRQTIPNNHRNSHHSAETLTKPHLPLKQRHREQERRVARRFLHGHASRVALHNPFIAGEAADDGLLAEVPPAA